MKDIFQLLLQSNTLNFIIVFALIVFLFVKLNFKQKIENIRNEIKEYVETAQNERIQAENELGRIKDEVARLPEKIENIRKSAENSVVSIGEKIQAEIESQKQDISNNARRIFNLETKNFKSKLTNLLSEKSVEAAKENAMNQLNADKSLHRKYIDNAIDELDRITL